MQLLQPQQRLLRPGRMRRAIGETVQARQGFVQAVEHQANQLALTQVTLGPWLGISRLPVALDHAGQQGQRERPAFPTSTAKPCGTQVRHDAQMLALLPQVLARRLLDVHPIDSGLLQATQLDHFLVDGLVGLILHIEQAGRCLRVNGCEQPGDFLCIDLGYQRHALRTSPISGSSP